MALSAAHDALLQNSWAQADLASIAATVIEAVGFTDRVKIDGPPVALWPQAAMSFSLIVHELLTNACKYGSLKGESGNVSLTWDIESNNGDERLTVKWREWGGPLVIPPARRGFGSKLISIGLVGTGGVDVRYDPAGFEADLQAQMRHLTRG